MYNNNYHPDDYQPAPPKRRRRKRRVWPGVLLVALSLALVFGAGMLGGEIAYRRFADQTAQPGATSENPVVLYQTAQTGISELSAQTELSTPYERVAAAAAPSVVEIATESVVMNRRYGSYIESGAGSGIIISQDGYIVTNHHVISGASAVVVRTRDGVEYEARVIGTDALSDIAVLKVNASGLTPVVFADSDQINVGQAAIAIGNPLGELGGSVTEGIISAKDREIVIDGDVMRLLQTTAAINPGNSGGGLFNANGELIGVVNAKSSGAEIEGLGFAIPSNTAQAIIPQLIEYGYVKGRPMMGVQAVYGAERSSRYNSFSAWYGGYGQSDYGVYVTQVYAQNGLEQYDRIVAVEGKEIADVADVSRILQDRAVGDTVRLTIVRGGQTMDVDVTLIERGADHMASDIY